jgi:hypothetical protein
MALFDQEDDDNKDFLAELTGPGGKFDKSKYASETEMYQAIAKGKVYSDRTIEHKNKEFDELREAALKWRADSVAKARFDEYVKTHNNGQSNTDTTHTPVDEVKQPQLDPVKIKEFVRTEFQQMKDIEREEANLNRVESQLRERFGENSKQVLKEKMNTLNLSQDDLKYLAKKSPEAVMNALGLNQQQDTYQAPPRGDLRSDSFKPETTLRDAVYWEKMRTTNSKEYFSPKNSVQRLKDMDHPDFLKRYNARV